MAFETKIVLIRHGMTKGNKEKRYVGTTDEGLLEAGIAALAKKRSTLFPVRQCYVSPLKRCRQTADVLFPDAKQIVIDDFRECDFGLFEYRNYAELNGNAAYQQFIDTNGKVSFPDGEGQESFCFRVSCAFERLMNRVLHEQVAQPYGCEPICIIAHGGTIMAILSSFAVTAKPFYEWMLGNGSHYEADCFLDKEGMVRLDSVRKYEDT